MTARDRIATPGEAPPYAPFAADDEALTATRHNEPLPSGWSLAGPLLTVAVMVAVYILHQMGVW